MTGILKARTALQCGKDDSVMSVVQAPRGGPAMRVPEALIVGAILFCLSPPMSESAFARVTWSEIGSIQILEGPERIFVFVEVVRITDYTDEVLMHLMSKHPDEEIVSQTVFTVDRLGHVTEQVIAGNRGPTFHPNLGLIFRQTDSFYLYRFPSAGRPASLYRWRGDRFSLLDERESKQVKKNLPDERKPRLEEELKAISERDGWRCFAENVVMLTKTAQPFESARHQINISVQLGDKLAEPSAKREGRTGGAVSGLRLLRPSAGVAALSDLAKLRPSAIVASSTLKDRLWSRTLIEVNTESKWVGRKSRSRP